MELAALATPNLQPEHLLNVDGGSAREDKHCRFVTCRSPLSSNAHDPPALVDSFDVTTIAKNLWNQVPLSGLVATVW